MKYQRNLFYGLVILVVIVPGQMDMAYAGIATTNHNLSVAGPGAVKSIDETEICVFCHTPHRAIKNDNIPLWNHNLSTAGNYGVYTSPTFDGATTYSGLVISFKSIEAMLCSDSICYRGAKFYQAYLPNK